MVVKIKMLCWLLDSHIIYSSEVTFSVRPSLGPNPAGYPGRKCITISFHPVLSFEHRTRICPWCLVGPRWGSALGSRPDYSASLWQARFICAVNHHSNHAETIILCQALTVSACPGRPLPLQTTMVFHQSSSYAEVRAVPAQCHAAEVLDDSFVHMQSKKHLSMYSSQVVIWIVRENLCHFSCRVASGNPSPLHHGKLP